MPQSRSWRAGASVTTEVSLTFLQTGSPARHTHVRSGHPWPPHPMSSHLTGQRGGVSPLLSRPLPSEPQQRGQGLPGPLGARGSADWARCVPSQGSCLLGWQLPYLGLGATPRVFVLTGVRICRCSCFSSSRSQSRIMTQILSSGVNKPKFIGWLFH